MGFRNCYYDYKLNKIHLTETWNGKSVRVDEKNTFSYYVEDKTGKSDIKDVFGKSVKKQTSQSRESMKSLVNSGFYCCETDIAPDIKYLQDRYAGVKMEDNIDDFNICYIDIELAAKGCRWQPQFAEAPINLITVKSSKTGEVCTFGTSEFTNMHSDYVRNYAYIPDESDMLERFVKWFRKQKFDVITGWNVKKFDVYYIINRIKKLRSDKLEEKLSPINKIDYNKKYDEFSIPGISILDYMELYKNFTFHVLPSYSLQSVAQYEIGEGKLDLDGQINTIYETDWNKFVEYNVQDVLLVEKLEIEKKFIELTVRLCYQALIPIEKVFSSVAVLEGYILNYLHQNKMVMPDRKKEHVDWWKDGNFNNVDGYLQNTRWEDNAKDFNKGFVKGGHVEANPGFYQYNVSFDVESLYPRKIMMYNISPETKVIMPEDTTGLIKSEINEVYYRKDVEGIIPTIVKRIFGERKMFKKMMFEANKKGDKTMEKYYDSQQHIRKIMINSMYGVLANEGFHFYDVDNARAITRGGRVLIRHLSSTVNSYFADYWPKVAHKYFDTDCVEPIVKKVVCVVDTDSNYINLEEVKAKYAPNMDTLEFVTIMDEEVLTPFFQKVLDIYAKKIGVPNETIFKREGIITKQFVLAKKKYITELLKDEDRVFDPPKIKYKGVEVVRSDTPVFCQENIQTVVTEIFATLDKGRTLEILRGIKREFKKQKVELISSVSGVKEYSKYDVPVARGTLRYKSSTPIHVRASICYNAMITRQQLDLMPVSDGTKIKYIYLDDKNTLNSNVIGYVGKYPEVFDNFFKVDHDLQFEKTFLGVITRMFTALNWGPVILKESKMKGFIKKRKKK
jgi:DNA polymerase elongation subunit (family B)